MSLIYLMFHKLLIYKENPKLLIYLMFHKLLIFNQIVLERTEGHCSQNLSVPEIAI